MKKRLLSALLSLILLLSLLPMSVLAAETVDSGDCGVEGSSLTWTLDAEGTLTITGEGAMADYSANKAPWNAHKSDILFLVVESGVTTLGSNAFSGCKNLSAVTLPESITAIGDNAFYGCKALTEITIPDSVAAIGSSAFSNCAALKTLTMGTGVTEVGDYAFSGCKALESVVLPDGVKVIGDNAFSDCDGLKTVTIPVGTETLGEDVFDGCDALSDVYYNGAELVWLLLCHGAEIPAAFHFADPAGRIVASGSCGTEGDNLSWTLTDEGQLSITGSGTMADYSKAVPAPWYDGRTAIREITIGDNVSSIGAQAFLGCSALESITIPENITAIGARAFSGCAKLREIQYNAGELKADATVFAPVAESVKLICGESVKTIPAQLFSDCAALTEIVFMGSAPAMDAAFGNVTAVARYPYGDATWTDEVMRACGEGITWKVYSTAPITGCECIAPDKIAYMPREELDTTGLKLVLLHADGCHEEMEVAAGDLTLGDYDMTLSGWQTIGISCGEYESEFSIFIHDTKINIMSPKDYPESAHNYADNLDSTSTWKAEDALWLDVTFSTQTDLADDCLYINETPYTGTSLAGQTITVSGDTLTIRLVSDEADNAYGFAIDRIAAIFPEHEYTKTEVIAPTCDKAGYTEHICLCGASYQDSYTNALGHDYGDWTALNDQQHQRVCKNDPSHVQMANHIWNNGTVTKEPTETDTGVRTYACITCGATREETIPALGHTHVYTAVVTKPTCTKAGYTTYTCACGHSYVDDRTDALDHNFGDWQVTKAATCEERGSETHTCARCGVTETHTILALGHHYTTTVKKPTYTTKGYTLHECTCGDSYVDSYTDMLTLAKPKAPTLTNTKDGITVKWTKVDGATAYQVFRKNGDDAWKRIKTVTDGTSYADNTSKTNGKRYRYRIVAIARNDEGKIVNQSVNGSYKTIYRVITPTLSSVKSSSAGKITVQWSKNSKASGYQIKYVLGDTIKTTRITNVNTLTKTISKLTRGKTYKIYIRAYKTVDDTNYYSAYSSYKSVKVAK